MQSWGKRAPQPGARAGAPTSWSGERAPQRGPAPPEEGRRDQAALAGERRGPGTATPSAGEGTMLPSQPSPRPQSCPRRGPRRQGGGEGLPQRGPPGGEKPLKKPGLRPPGSPAPSCLRRRATSARNRGERRGRPAAPRRVPSLPLPPPPPPPFRPTRSADPRSPHRTRRRSSSTVARPRWQPVRAQPEAATLQSRATSAHAPSRSAARGARWLQVPACSAPGAAHARGGLRGRQAVRDAARWSWGGECASMAVLALWVARGCGSCAWALALSSRERFARSPFPSPTLVRLPGAAGSRLGLVIPSPPTATVWARSLESVLYVSIYTHPGYGYVCVYTCICTLQQKSLVVEVTLQARLMLLWSYRNTWTNLWPSVALGYHNNNWKFLRAQRGVLGNQSFYLSSNWDITGSSAGFVTHN